MRTGRNTLVISFFLFSNLCQCLIKSRWKPTAGGAWETSKGTATLIGEQGEAGECTQGPEVQGQCSILPGDPMNESDSICPELNSPSSRFCLLLLLCSSTTNQIYSCLLHNLHILLSLFFDLNVPVFMSVFSVKLNNIWTRAVVQSSWWHSTQQKASPIESLPECLLNFCMPSVRDFG